MMKFGQSVTHTLFLAETALLTPSATFALPTSPRMGSHKCINMAFRPLVGNLIILILPIRINPPTKRGGKNGVVP